MKKLLPLAVLAALSSVHVASAQAADVSAAVPSVRPASRA